MSDEQNPLVIYGARFGAGQTRAVGTAARLSDVPADERAELEKNLAKWRAMQSAPQTEAQRRALELGRRGAPAVAFVGKGIIKPPAIALVVRDPAGEIPRLVVLEEGATDWTYYLTRRAFAADEVVNYDVRGRRVFSVLANGQGRGLDGEDLQRIPPFRGQAPATAERSEVEELLALAKRSDPVDLAGIGPAWVAR